MELNEKDWIKIRNDARTTMSIAWSTLKLANEMIASFNKTEKPGEELEKFPGVTKS